jgi:hypothetical protein
VPIVQTWLDALFLKKKTIIKHFNSNIRNGRVGGQDRAGPALLFAAEKISKHTH